MQDETIGQRLRKAIDEAGYSMRSFAQAADLPYRSVQSYASDQQRPGADALIKIRESLGISIDWLLCGRKKPKFVAAVPRPEEATAGDIEEICGWIHAFEDPELTADIIASHIKSNRKLSQFAEQSTKMLDRLREHQASGALPDVDLDRMKIREFQALYIRELGEPDF